MSRGGFTLWLFSCGAAYHFSPSCCLTGDDHGNGDRLAHGRPVAGKGTGASAGAKPDEGSGVGGRVTGNHGIVGCFQTIHRFGKKHLDGRFFVMIGERGQEICAKEGDSQEGHGGGRK